MAWQTVGEISVSPGDDLVEVGPVSVPAIGGFAISVRQIEPTPFAWGNGVISFVSDYGRELGSVVVWPGLVRQCYWLGAHLTARDTSGVLVFEPKPWNLRWITAGFPLVLAIEADL